MANVLLGVTGGIACYKACEVASRLVKGGHAVDVVMTKNAQEFVRPLTFQTLVKAPVYTDSFAPIEDYSVEHISLAKRADLCLICPATANVIGKLAAGIADDLLTTVLLAAWEKPLVVCPAMNTAMYENPAVQENLAKLRARGAHIVEPGEGLLACGDEGRGRLAEPAEITAFLQNLLKEAAQ
ncbi:MAG: phosphopantothenoylcysteine decarboxylase [Clostridiales Family XIII bacterium]|jgi:phosphopantothenoylcysteine decarboxylase/phosphopantothenoylcysteine decarboxylase/phosphopantothenate--cysteine ligase|nr:phosphopantothenoylcysteine decarboxylase [Clostridiales Family XIII bacterium]